MACACARNRQGGRSTIILERCGAEPEEIVVETDRWLYGIEADVVAENIDNRQARFPAMSHADTLGNMRVLDAWRRQVGVVYPQEDGR